MGKAAMLAALKRAPEGAILSVSGELHVTMFKKEAGWIIEDKWTSIPVFRDEAVANALHEAMWVIL